MQIKLNKSKSVWIDISEGFKVKIDYPTVEQSDALQDLLFGFTNEDNNSIDMNSADFLKFQKLYLKYVIKDWSGLLDESKNEIPCKLRKLKNGDTELSIESYGIIASLQHVWLISLLYTKIEPELRFIEVDKKKLELLENSGEVVSS